jgi:hypothetical protein
MSARDARFPHRRLLVGSTLAGALAVSLAVWAANKAEPPAEEQEVDAGASTSDTVRILIQTVPARKAQVRWGRKLLGTIPAPRPLVIERPRDSGPLDIVIRASGYLPVHTRAYTFSDSRVSVKLTPPAEKSKLFGYKQEPAPNPDGGVPADSPWPAPTTPTAAPPAP